jgi:hypothetical protein
MASIISAGTTSGTSLNLSGDTSGVLQLASNGSTTAVTIDTSQNVGIGTTSPAAPIDVVSNSSAIGLSVRGRSDNAGVIRWMSNDGATVNGRIQVNSGGDMIFQNTNSITERMRIDSSGNLLVGTTSSITGGRSAFWSSTAAAAAEFRVNAGSSDATQAVTIIKNSTTNSTAQVLMNFTINNGNTGAGQINCNGASAAAFGTFSDVRLKENIVDLPPQLDNILSIRPVEFDYIESEGGGHQIGFIAQEFEEVYADSVGERADGMKTLTGWSKTEARLVKAIQELNAKVEAQAVRIAELEGAK